MNKLRVLVAFAGAFAIAFGFSWRFSHDDQRRVSMRKRWLPLKNLLQVKGDRLCATDHNPVKVAKMEQDFAIAARDASEKEAHAAASVTGGTLTSIFTLFAKERAFRTATSRRR